MDSNKLLLDKNIKVTKNRIAILDCLADDTHFHTVKEIIEHVGGLNSKSVYNNIKILIEAGLVDTYSFGGISKYALNDHFKDLHDVAHIVNAGNVKHININPKTIKSIKKQVKAEGYEPNSVNIFINIKK